MVCSSQAWCSSMPAGASHCDHASTNDRLAVPAELRERLSPRRDPVVLLGRLGDEETLAVHAQHHAHRAVGAVPDEPDARERADRGQPVDRSRRARYRQATGARHRCSPDHRSDRVARTTGRARDAAARRRAPARSARTASSPPSVRVIASTTTAMPSTPRADAQPRVEVRRREADDAEEHAAERDTRTGVASAS